jgi:diguanylate cyclase (GGDEF)-like protein
MVHEDDARILIVDDHEDNVELLRARLEAWGYRTICASDGASALRAVYDAKPDLILLDVMMPQVDGLEVARRIRGDPKLPFIPIILQTALDSVESKIEGLEAGADDYITKPIHFSELQARVRSLLRIKALQDELARREHDLAEMNDQLLRISRLDGLTGLANRRYLEERLEEMWEHAERLGEPLACVMCDIDKFKSVNDTYGHQAGDAVLRDFAGILEREAREIDRVGRYGGEEFVVLLPGTVLDAAVTFAERVRTATEAHTFAFDGVEIRRTVSCGVAGWPHPRIASCEGLVRAADDALYVAKETGRNRVVRFDSREFNEHTQPEHDASERDADVTARAVQPQRGDRSPGGPDLGASARA